MMNSFLLILALFLLIRHIGCPVISSMAFFLFLFFFQTVPDYPFLNTWPPDVILLPFLLVCIAASVLAAGFAYASIILAFAGILCGHHQLGTIPPVFMASVTGLVFFFRKHGRPVTYRDKVNLGTAAGLVILAAIPVFLEQIIRETGNMTQVFHYFWIQDHPMISLTLAVKAVGRTLLPLTSIRLTESLPVNVTVVLAPLAMACFGYLNRSEMIRRLSFIVHISSAVFLITCFRLPRYSPQHSLNLYRMLAALALFVFLATMMQLIRGNSIFERLVPYVSIVFCLTGLVVFCSDYLNLGGYCINRFEYIDEIVVDFEISPETPVRLHLEEHGPHSGSWRTATGLAYKIVRMGGNVSIDPDWEYMFGTIAMSDRNPGAVDLYFLNPHQPVPASLLQKGVIQRDRVYQNRYGKTRIVEVVPYNLQDDR